MARGQIIDNDAFLHVTLDVSELPASGGTVEVTVVREDLGNLSTPLSVALDATSPALASLPAAVVIPSGADRFSVTLTLAATDPMAIGLTATATGFDAATASLVVFDDTSNPWQNALKPFDVNNDGSISPLDVLIIVNFLNANGVRTLSAPTDNNRPPPYLDPSGDGVVAPIDVLLIVNFLNASPLREGEGLSRTLNSSSITADSQALATDIALTELMLSRERWRRAKRPDALSLDSHATLRVLLRQCEQSNIKRGIR